MVAVAEGVETAEQLDALVTLGCDLGQGDLFAPPLDPRWIKASLFAVGAVQLSAPG
jgi:EAL domain-containing protein (putative c-di-GMP-specific phosphodiesterase class I)